MFNARDLLHLTEEQLWSFPDGQFDLQFDDGVIHTTTRETVFSWYCWAIQREFPNAPLLKRHHINGNRLGAKTHLELCGHSYWDCFDAYQGQCDTVKMKQITYRLTNDLYNAINVELEEYVNTISALDFVDVVLHPKIAQFKQEAKPTVSGIEHSYNGCWGVLMDPNDELMKDNAIAASGKSGFTKRGQIMQCCVHRGFVTDRDSTIFPKAIMSSYAEGINDISDFAADSRSATMALSYAKGPLAIVEYFNRKMQLGAGHIRRVHKVDCGSTSYMLWLVRAGDLKTIVGKNYMDDDGVLKQIKETDKHLIGRTLRLRSAHRCRHPDRGGVCGVCFGALSDSIPDNAALGHVCLTVMCEEGTQKVLSTKHELGSASANDFVVAGTDANFIANGVDETAIYISTLLPLSGSKLLLTASEMPNINEIYIASNVEALPLTRISNLTSIGIMKDTPMGPEFNCISVAVGSRESSLSHAMLRYIKQYGWKPLADGSYEVDLTHWDVDEPAFILPMRHLSMVAYLTELEGVIRATKRVKKGKGTPTLKNYDTHDEAVKALYDIINSKLFLNLTYVEIIVKTTLIKSSATGDYRIPIDGEPYEISSFSDRMLMGSMGGSMGYQTQSDVLMSPKSYVYKNRMPHVLDDLLVP